MYLGRCHAEWNVGEREMVTVFRRGHTSKVFILKQQGKKDQGENNIILKVKATVAKERIPSLKRVDFSTHSNLQAPCIPHHPT